MELYSIKMYSHVLTSPSPAPAASRTHPSAPVNFEVSEPEHHHGNKKPRTFRRSRRKSKHLESNRHRQTSASQLHRQTCRLHTRSGRGCTVYPKDLQKHVAKGQAEREQVGEKYDLTECKECGKKWCTRGCKPKHQCGADEEEVDEEEERQRRRSKYLEEFNKKFGEHHYRISQDQSSGGQVRLSVEEQAEFVREFNARYGHRNAAGGNRVAVQRSEPSRGVQRRDIDSIIDDQIQHEVARGLRASNGRQGMGDGKVVFSAEQTQEFVREFNARYGHQNAAATTRAAAQHSDNQAGEESCDEDDMDTMVEEQRQHELAVGLQARKRGQDSIGDRVAQQQAATRHAQSSGPNVLDDLGGVLAAAQHGDFVRGFYARHGQRACSATSTTTPPPPPPPPPPPQKSSRARQSLNATGIDGSALLADPFVDLLPSSNPSVHVTPSQPSSCRRRKRAAEDEAASEQEHLTPASKRSYSGVPYEQRNFLCPNTPCEYAANKKHTLQGHQKAALKETAQRAGQTHVPCTHCGKHFCTFSAARRHDCDAPQAALDQASDTAESELAPANPSNNDRQPISMSDAAIHYATEQYDDQRQQYTHSSPSPTKPPMDQIHHRDHLFSLMPSPSPYIKPEATPEPPLPGPDRVMPSSSIHKPSALGPSSDTGHWVYDALEKDYPLLSSELMAQMVYSVEIGPLQYVWPSDVVYLRKLPRLAHLGKNVRLVWEEGEFDENRRSERDVLIRGRLRHWGMEKEQVEMKGVLVKEKGWEEKEAEEFVWGEEFVAELYERANRGELDPSVQEAEEWFAEELRGHEESGKQPTK
ncbi:hypothetical protein AC579_3146 [Pseudocercospora musae]|uniref:Uncharacterized protein n=1 Tax=Pseudocercospora musae TaxID=113226 RepID=A0A139H5P7_9PEZI|nr:hypothetical protein AC579_3146 [Pseudocercospora musae]